MNTSLRPAPSNLWPGRVSSRSNKSLEFLTLSGMSGIIPLEERCAADAGAPERCTPASDRSFALAPAFFVPVANEEFPAMKVPLRVLNCISSPNRHEGSVRECTLSPPTAFPPTFLLNRRGSARTCARVLAARRTDRLFMLLNVPGSVSALRMIRCRSAVPPFSACVQPPGIRIPRRTSDSYWLTLQPNVVSRYLPAMAAKCTKCGGNTNKLAQG